MTAVSEAVDRYQAAIREVNAAKTDAESARAHLNAAERRLVAAENALVRARQAYESASHLATRRVPADPAPLAIESDPPPFAPDYDLIGDMERGQDEIVDHRRRRG